MKEERHSSALIDIKEKHPKVDSYDEPEESLQFKDVSNLKTRPAIINNFQ